MSHFRFAPGQRVTRVARITRAATSSICGRLAMRCAIASPRFIVTSLHEAEASARSLYDDL